MYLVFYFKCTCKYFRCYYTQRSRFLLVFKVKYKKFRVIGMRIFKTKFWIAFSGMPYYSMPVHYIYLIGKIICHHFFWAPCHIILHINNLIIFQKLLHLESLNLCACKHLTDRSASALSKHAKNLRELNLSWISTISEAAIINLMTKCPKLVFLDIYDHKISAESRSVMTDIARQRKMKIVLKGLTDQEIALENPCSLLPNFGKVW